MLLVLRMRQTVFGVRYDFTCKRKWRCKDPKFYVTVTEKARLYTTS